MLIQALVATVQQALHSESDGMMVGVDIAQVPAQSAFQICNDTSVMCSLSSHVVLRRISYQVFGVGLK